MAYNPDSADPKDWFDMQQFVKSGKHIGSEEPPNTRLANLNIDTQPSPSPQGVTAEGWSLAVRDWGVVVITANGVRLLWRKDLGNGTVDRFGRPFP